MASTEVEDSRKSAGSEDAEHTLFSRRLRRAPEALRLPTSVTEPEQEVSSATSSLSRLRARRGGLTQTGRDALATPDSASPSSAVSTARQLAAFGASKQDAEGGEGMAYEGTLSSPTSSDQNFSPSGRGNAIDALKRRRNVTRAQSASAVIQRMQDQAINLNTIWNQGDDESEIPSGSETSRTAKTENGHVHSHFLARRRSMFPPKNSEGALDRRKDERSSLRPSVPSPTQKQAEEEDEGPLDEPEEVLETCLQALERAASATRKELDWEEQQRSLQKCVRLVRNHPDVVTRRAKDISRATLPSLKSLRSGVVRCALALFHELFLAVGSKADGELEAVLPGLCKQCGEQGFLAAEADKAIEGALEQCTLQKAVSALLLASHNSSWQVRRKAAYHLEKALAEAAEGRNRLSEDAVAKAVQRAASLLDEGSLHCRTLAKRCLFHAAKLYGGNSSVLSYLAEEKARKAKQCLNDSRGMPPPPDKPASAGSTRYAQPKPGTAPTRTATDVDWRARLSAVRSARQRACDEADRQASLGEGVDELSDGALLEDVSLLCKRAADGSPQVAIAALDGVAEVSHRLPSDDARRLLAPHVPAIAAATSSSSEDAQKAAMSCLDVVIGALGPKQGVKALGAACERDNIRARPTLLELLCQCAQRGDTPDSTLLKHALPAAFACIHDERSRPAAGRLLQRVAGRFGRDAILSRAARLAAPSRAKVREVLLQGRGLM